MNANDLEDNDWVNDVFDFDFEDDDDADQYDLESLAANPKNRAQRIFFERWDARKERTEEEIEALGIRPNAMSIVHHISEWEEETRSLASRGRMVPSVRTLSDRVRRVYHRAYGNYSSGEEEEEKEDEEQVIAKWEDEFETVWQSQLVVRGLEGCKPLLLREYRAIARERFLSLKQSSKIWKAAQRPPKRPKPTIDLLATLCTTPELLIEVCKHLPPRDIVNIYALHRGFHDALNHNMRKFIFAWARSMAPVAAKIYSSPVYSHWFIPDPAGRTATWSDRDLSRPQPGQAILGGEDLHINSNLKEVRLVPGLFWLQHVVHREVRVRDILAVLARRGHRTLPGTNATLQKMWLVLDCPTNKMRMQLFVSRDFITDEDLYRFQLFFVKLVLLCNDPFFGPGSTILPRLFLGQKGLSPLWKFLRKKEYRGDGAIRQLKIRYDVAPKSREIWEGKSVMGVEIYDMGVIQFEGWANGGMDLLMRPEELMMTEAGRRGLDLMGGWQVLFRMMTYGHVDYATGSNLVPSLEEMYMSDDGERAVGVGKVAGIHENSKVNGGCGNVPFERGMWQPKHARKRRWKELTQEEKDEIVKEEEKEMVRAEKVNKAMDLFLLARRKLEDVYNVTAMGFQGDRFGFKLPAPTAEDRKEDIADLKQLLLFRIKAAMVAARRAAGEESETDSVMANKMPPAKKKAKTVAHESDEEMEDVDQHKAEDVAEDQVGKDEGYEAESDEYDDEGWEEYENDPMDVDSPPSNIPSHPTPPPPPPPHSPPPRTLADIIDHDNHLNTIWSSPTSVTITDPTSFNALPVSERYPLFFGSDLPSSPTLTPAHGAYAVRQVAAHLPPEHHLWDPSNIDFRQSSPDTNNSSDLDFSDWELETIPIPPQEIASVMSGQYLLHPLPTSTPPPPPSLSPHPPPSSSSSSSSSPSPPPAQLPIPAFPTSSSTSSNSTTMDPAPLPSHLSRFESLPLPSAAAVLSAEADEALKALADEEYGSTTESDLNAPDGGIDWDHVVTHPDVYRVNGNNYWNLTHIPIHPDWRDDQARTNARVQRKERREELERRRVEVEKSVCEKVAVCSALEPGEEKEALEEEVVGLWEVLRGLREEKEKLLEEEKEEDEQQGRLEGGEVTGERNWQVPTREQREENQRDRVLPSLEVIRRQRWPSQDDDDDDGFWESPRVRRARDWYPRW
ncbi:hypothetical protein QBC40DRAFT_336981 [Triangularia verruculosa]|uniref:F-box domain-containing protein n=1 Tax=Triangularia verruculosa TaxID=2587418 RepID=A0AAN6XPL0_9PEZI|nr:hypothetical protein QBC40DRAFT_336981 [Triangularia verruculosa]